MPNTHDARVKGSRADEILSSLRGLERTMRDLKEYMKTFSEIVTGSRTEPEDDNCKQEQPGSFLAALETYITNIKDDSDEILNGFTFLREQLEVNEFKKKPDRLSRDLHYKH